MDENKKVELNREFNYGGLVGMDDHMASVGIEVPDDKNRNFQIFRKNTTAVGSDYYATMAFRKIASSPTLEEIRKNTKYSPSDEESVFEKNYLLGTHGEILLKMKAVCRNGKLFIAAYVDTLI